MLVARTEGSGTVAGVLVDTDLFVEHLRGERELKAGRNVLHYSTLTRAELVVGNSAPDLVDRLLAPFREHAVDREIADRAGELRRQTGVRLADAVIAATALEHGLSLATRNRGDYEAIRSLRLRNLA